MEIENELQFQNINILWYSKFFLKRQHTKTNVIFRPNYFDVCYYFAIYNDHHIHLIFSDLVHKLVTDILKCTCSDELQEAREQVTDLIPFPISFHRHCEHMASQQWLDASSRHFLWFQWTKCLLDTFNQLVRTKWEVVTGKSALVF